MAEITLTNENFDEEVIKSDVPVLVDFWAPWCGPCKMLSPLIDEIARESDGSYKVAKVNCDDEGDLAARYSVASIPTLIVFDKGEIKNKSVGAIPKAKILELLK